MIVVGSCIVVGHTQSLEPGGSVLLLLEEVILICPRLRLFVWMRENKNKVFMMQSPLYSS